MKLKAPLILFDRLKLSVIIIAYVLMGEWVDPRPFNNGIWARGLYLILILEVIRQFWTYRLEVSPIHVARNAHYRSNWERFRDRFSTNARYRFRRLMIIFGGVYVFGWAVDGMSNACSGPIQCALTFPRMIFENIPMIIQVMFIIAMSMAQLGAMFYVMTKVGFLKVLYPGTLDVEWDDIFGQDKAKQRVMEQVALLNDSEEIESAGGFMPKGLLLWGPPGTGKTMLAKAAASQSTKPLILVPPGGFASTFIGINFLKVWQLGKTVRRLAMRYDGVVVFIDEIDALGNRGAEVADTHPYWFREYWNDDPGPMWCGSSLASLPTQAQAAAAVPWGKVDKILYKMIVGTGGGGMNMGTLEAFLAMLDGMEEPRGLVNKILKALGFKPLPAPKFKALWMGATNVPSKIDVALTRAGRLGLKIHVKYPDAEGRLLTYKGYLDKVSSDVPPVKVKWIARRHYKGTGADIQDAVNEALLIAFRDGRKKVMLSDLLHAIKWKQHGDAEGTFEDPKRVTAVAIHEAGHAVAYHYLQGKQGIGRIFMATIEKHGQTGGFVAPSPTYEDWHRFEEELWDEMSVGMASRAVEVLHYDQASNGHGGDGRYATDQAIKMINWGHGSDQTRLALMPTEDRDNARWEARVEEMLHIGFGRTMELMEPLMPQVLAVAALLEEHLTVDGDMIHDLLDEMDELQ